MSVRLIELDGGKSNPIVSRFLKRPAFDAGAEAVAATVLEDIKKSGNKAVLACAERFDGVSLRASQMRVTDAEIAEARQSVDGDFKRATRETAKRVTAFARAGLRANWEMPTPRGGRMGEVFVPLDRVGVYVPGGKAPLASTALMTIPLARTAGVPEIVVCTPCASDGTIDPRLLYAIDMAGATEIYKVGGIHAIGMMAYGTRTVAKVQKIVGPGGPYVTAAKRQVYGHVSLDLVAGPSEIAVLADESANPRHVACDLLSQAEHGTGWEKALLVTTSLKLARDVDRELDALASSLSREKAIRKVMRKGMLLVVVKNLDDGVELCNEFAPEHLELMVHRPRSCLKGIHSAGAVFVGPWTPESAGDFVAGPSHVLPTGGAASMFAGLTVDDFRRRMSVIEFTKNDLHDVVPVIEAFGRVEGLDAHAKSATLRFESDR